MGERRTFSIEALQQIRETPRLSDMVYEALREAISTGKIEPGERLREEVLAKELGVSRFPVRDALNRLVADGLAVQEPYKGVRAVIVPTEQFVEVYRLRAMMEAYAMEEAAKKISAADLARMRELLPQTVPASQEAADLARARKANRDFHWTAILASGLPRVIRYLEQLWELMVPFGAIPELSPDQREADHQEDLREHEAILSALEARDPVRAHEAATLGTWAHMPWAPTRKRD
jgi:DNA-binding GntR family transcriptional regulator